MVVRWLFWLEAKPYCACGYDVNKSWQDNRDITSTNKASHLIQTWYFYFIPSILFFITFIILSRYLVDITAHCIPTGPKELCCRKHEQILINSRFNLLSVALHIVPWKSNQAGEKHNGSRYLLIKINPFFKSTSVTIKWKHVFCYRFS